jgi:hypothetical protein
LTKIYKLFVWNEYSKNFVCKLKPIIIESYTESNESLKITRLRNPIVVSGLLLKQTQAYIYIRLIASGIDKIHNCPKCLKEKHFQKFCWPPQFTTIFEKTLKIDLSPILQAYPLNTWILFRLDFGPFVVNWGGQQNFWKCFSLRHFGQLCILSILDAIKRI